MKEIMTQEEMENYFTVSTNSLADWRRQGLRVVKIGRRNFYKADSIREFFDTKELCEYQR